VGIESLHDALLRKMNKGGSALGHVAFLKHARENGLFAAWNFLWDVPGEEDRWYEEMAEWLPWIAHLQPPGVDRIRFHRFSAYHDRPGDFGLSLRPVPGYSRVYPLNPEDLGDLAYFFEDPDRPSVPSEMRRRPGLRSVMGRIAEWQTLWGMGVGDEGSEALPPSLRIEKRGPRLAVIDSRPCAAGDVYEPDEPEALLLSLCEDPTPEEKVQDQMNNVSPSPSPGALERALGELRRRRLLLSLGGRLLSLPTKNP
jgi:magnesium-protoporphyrin IX monomethyl ester (oxidative) cyclase